MTTETKSSPYYNVPTYRTLSPAQITFYERDGWNETKIVAHLLQDGSRKYGTPALYNVRVDGGTIITTSGNRQTMNYCWHSKSALAYDSKRGHPAFMLEAPGTLSDGTRYWHAKYFFGCYQPPYFPAIETTPPGVTEGLRKQAWVDLLPKLNDGHSLANFLLELKDFRDVMKLSRSLNHQFKTLEKLGPFDRTKSLAELHLAWSFGIAPFLSDIIPLLENFLGWREKLIAFIQRGRTPQNFHHTNVLYDEELADEYVSRMGCVKKRRKAVYHATLRCSYTYKVPSNLDAFLRINGLRLTPEVIWNAIPFSFIPDWVYGIGKMLSQFDKDPNIKVHIHGYCDSIKSTQEHRYFRCPSAKWFDQYYKTGMTVGGWTRSEPMWVTSRTFYERVPCLPNTEFALPVSDELSARELVLAGALLHTLI